jgi:hypothetical protein
MNAFIPRALQGGKENVGVPILASRMSEERGGGQLVPNSFQSGFILSGDGPSPPLFVRSLESAMILV